MAFFVALRNLCRAVIGYINSARYEIRNFLRNVLLLYLITYVRQTVEQDEESVRGNEKHFRGHFVVSLTRAYL